ncbi:nuclear pore complex protein 14-like isoform X2 [Centruroides sculpturatus]|uniref:nuclear pore complex protein 14-like isoform X2 n=1 Tax=Centruroides sculpturatus TaxID=218467 RepID=UPI000C6D9E89|nr:nuclear pore complex protein 14-like isoform X2 [Centruroides sculpturatus]
MWDEPPVPQEVNWFGFRSLRKLQIPSALCDKDVVNIVASSSKYGLIFVGCEQGFKVLKLDDVLNLNSDTETLKQEAVEYPCQHVTLDSSPVLLNLSCDDMTVVACILKDESYHAKFFDITSFSNASIIAEPFTSVRLTSTPNVFIRDMIWNPKVAEMFAVCLSDGTVSVYELHETSLKIVATLPSTIKATALSWSPKGKQIVIGKEDGSLSQYKPNLKETKAIPAPNRFENPVSVINILWLTTPVFAAVYVNKNSSDLMPSLVLISAQKGENVSYINYYEVCCGSTDLRSPRYWMYHQQIWNILICTSSNSIETGVLGLKNDNKPIWEQWILEETLRADLPLIKNQETYPMGMSVINCSQKPIVINEKESFPPMPILFLLSTKGYLCPFHIVNTSDVPSVISPPEPIPIEGKRKINISNNFMQNKQNLTSTPANLNNASTINKFPSNAPRINLNTSFNGFISPVKDNNSSSFVSSQNKDIVEKNQNQSSLISEITEAKDVSSKITMDKVDLIPKQSDNEVKSACKEGISKEESKKQVEIEDEKETSEDITTQQALVLLVQNEVAKFQKEVQNLQTKIANFKVNIGNKEEMKNFKTKMTKLEAFDIEIRENVESLSLDLHNLKSLVLETFAMIEDARSREMKSKDPLYYSLLKSRALDPISARKLKEIRCLYRYVDNQLQELHSKLDQERQDFLNAKKKMNKKPSPFSPAEAIYHVVQNNHNILPSLIESVDELASRTKKMNLENPSQPVSNFSKLYSDHSEELNKLAETLRLTKIQSVENDFPHKIKGIKREKEILLMNMLKNRSVSCVKAKKINDLSHSQLVAAMADFSKKKSISEQKSPISEQKVYIPSNLIHTENKFPQQSLEKSISEVKQPDIGLSSVSQNKQQSVFSPEITKTEPVVVPTTKQNAEKSVLTLSNKTANDKLNVNQIISQVTEKNVQPKEETDFVQKPFTIKNNNSTFPMAQQNLTTQSSQVILKSSTSLSNSITAPVVASTHSGISFSVPTTAFTVTSAFQKAEPIPKPFAFGVKSKMNSTSIFKLPDSISKEIIKSPEKLEYNNSEKIPSLPPKEDKNNAAMMNKPVFGPGHSSDEKSAFQFKLFNLIETKENRK